MQEPLEGTPYAWEKLMSAKRGIAQLVPEMKKMREKIEKILPVSKERAREIYEELLKLHGKLQDEISSCRLCLSEMELTQESAMAAGVHRGVKAFVPMTPDYAQFAAGIEGFLSRLPGGDEDEESGKRTNAAIIGRLMNFVRMGYYPTDLDHIEQIVRGIEFPEGVTTNLLDPCCGCGLALRRLADGNGCWTYGVEIDEGRAEEAQSRLHRVGVGSFFHSRISYDAFHVLFLNPPYLSLLKEGGGNTRSEKLFFVDGLKHLALGGLLVYIIPYYRITADIARILCDNFTDISVYRFMGKEFDRFKQTVVFGLRRERVNGSELVESLMERVETADKIPLLSDLPEKAYALPAKEIKVQTFKGAVFNELELYRQLKDSDSIARMLRRSELDSRERRPLLPLNIGQIGLIAGSGMINGLAEGAAPHIIKGRIIKELVRAGGNSDGEGIITETCTNKMLFNILTPDGLRVLN
jgi:methylase of polypeptide subunit release factors